MEEEGIWDGLKQISGAIRTDNGLTQPVSTLLNRWTQSVSYSCARSTFTLE